MLKNKWTAILLAMLLGVGLFGCENAYEKDQASSSSPVEEGQQASALQDGSYTAYYRDPAFDGAKDRLTISVQDGEVSIAQYELLFDESEPEESSQASDEMDAASETPDFERMADVVLEEYERAKSPEQMKPVVGALEHGWRFSHMMQMLLRAAEDGQEEDLAVDRYQDGEYLCTSTQKDREGLLHTLSVTVQDGQIASASLEADGTYDREIYDALMQEFVAQDGDTQKMQVEDGHYNAYKSLLRLAPSLMKGMITGEQTQAESAGWIDGAYRAQFSDFDENGWKRFLDVSIVGGVPVVTRFDAFDQRDETAFRSENVEIEERMYAANGINFVQATEQLLRSWEEAKMEVAAVDSVAGATVASNEFKVLLGELLATAAVEGNTAPIEVERFVSEPLEE